MLLRKTLERYHAAWNFPRFIAEESFFGGGIDITNKCNLKCTHCYWWRQEKNPDLDDKKMVEFMERVRSDGLRVVYLLGGEPLLRPEICAEAGRIFDFVMLFTNGTLGYPKLDNVRYSLSIDGPERIHDSLRGDGIFKKVTKILDEQSQKVMIHITVCRSNREHLRETIENFIHRKNVRGIYFCFYCPGSSADDDNSEFIPLVERNSVIDEIVGYRKEYGEKIFLTERVGHYLKTTGGLSRWNSQEKCVTKKLFKFYAADGNYKYHCAYGAEANCENCGCSQVPLMHALQDGDLESHKMSYLNYWGLYSYNDATLNFIMKHRLKKFFGK